MAVTKKIEIDGKQVEFKASAAITRIYRNKFGRDVYKDLMALNDAIKDQDEEASSLDGFSLEMFEDLSFRSLRGYPGGGFFQRQHQCVHDGRNLQVLCAYCRCSWFLCRGYGGSHWSDGKQRYQGQSGRNGPSYHHEQPDR